MSTSTVTYLGNLRTECQHTKSGKVFITDAPNDNNGKGEAFSPTDSVATSLASCMMTIMGIKARDLNLNLEQSRATVTKHMSSSPRKISKIEISFEITGVENEKEQKLLERIAKMCPVAASLHPDIEQVFEFHFL